MTQRRKGPGHEVYCVYQIWDNYGESPGDDELGLKRCPVAAASLDHHSQQNNVLQRVNVVGRHFEDMKQDQGSAEIYVFGTRLQTGITIRKESQDF